MEEPHQHGGLAGIVWLDGIDPWQKKCSEFSLNKKISKNPLKKLLKKIRKKMKKRKRKNFRKNPKNT
ncbi:MAG: hypothetical protein GYA23_07345 [Methanomicrobiales archaeon]|nr:hypothetical protein [Methanomicrobiales archaeon]